MHIADGILSPQVLAIGAAVSAGGVWIGLRRVTEEQIPQAAVLCSAFFVGSLINVPVPPTSVHLMLTGLVGVVLGWAAFPVLLVGLLLQALLFGHGGIAALGVNVMNFAVPAVVARLLLGRWIAWGSTRAVWLAGFAAGAGAVIMGFVLLSLCLLAGSESFIGFVAMLSLPNLGLALIEGFVTASALVFLRKVQPELIRRPCCPVEVTDACRP